VIAAHLPHGANAAALILGGSSAIHDHAASSFVREGLFLAVHHVFVALVVIAAALGLAVAAIPRRVVALTFDQPTASRDPVPTNSPAAGES
jgi:hypothetical protein